MRFRRRFCAVLLILMSAGSASPSAGAAQERVVEIPTRQGQSVRALLTIPANPKGAVILIAGGHGNLELGRDGRMGWGSGNQLVRSRHLYADAGYVTLVPDIAPNLKRPDGVVPRYRWSPQHAADIGALVAHLRTLAQPVHLIGTSRAALSVANAGVRTREKNRPDSLVITSGMLMHERDGAPSVQRVVPHLNTITQPTLLIAHANDACEHTPPSAPKRFAPLLSGAQRVDTKILTGGGPATGDPCGASGFHGFKGIDSALVQTIVVWLQEISRK